MESKRQLQVGSLIQREISTVLRNEGSYMYGDALVTVTNVKLTPDLELAKVYLSVFNVATKEAIIEAIYHNMSRMRLLLGERIRKNVRRIPKLDFYIDDTLDEMYKLNSLFDKLEAENQMGTHSPATNPENPTAE
jgi:ribosome-binding factor A